MSGPFKFLGASLKDNHGKPSFTRIASLMVLSVLMGTWAITCLRQNQFLPLGYDAVGLLLVVLGAKVAQHRREHTTSGGQDK